MDALSDAELQKTISDYTVFARVSPEHKVRIVKALQSRGEIVAMTGDGGSNDNYMYNRKIKSELLRRPSAWCPVAEAEHAAPSSTLRFNYEWFPIEPPVKGAIAFRHGGGPNGSASLLFADFHVESRQKSAVKGYWNSPKNVAAYSAFWNPWPVIDGDGDHTQHYY